jgi:hypothetical protein
MPKMLSKKSAPFSHTGYADQIEIVKDKDGKRWGWDGHAKKIGTWKILMEARKRNGLHVVKKVA